MTYCPVCGTPLKPKLVHYRFVTRRKFCSNKCYERDKYQKQRERIALNKELDDSYERKLVDDKPVGYPDYIFAYFKELDAMSKRRDDSYIVMFPIRSKHRIGEWTEV